MNNQDLSKTKIPLAPKRKGILHTFYSAAIYGIWWPFSTSCRPWQVLEKAGPLNVERQSAGCSQSLYWL
jgi:hypothetical protein